MKLSQFSQNRQSNLSTLLYSEKISAINEAIRLGADVNALLKTHPYWSGLFSPLHIAILNNNLPIATFLLRNGANINLQSSGSLYTPLHLAPNARVRHYLLNKGADTNIRDSGGWTSLSINYHSPFLALALFTSFVLSAIILTLQWIGLGCNQQNIHVNLQKENACQTTGNSALVFCAFAAGMYKWLTNSGVARQPDDEVNAVQVQQEHQVKPYFLRVRRV